MVKDIGSSLFQSIAGGVITGTITNFAMKIFPSQKAVTYFDNLINGTVTMDRDMEKLVYDMRQFQFIQDGTFFDKLYRTIYKASEQLSNRASPSDIKKYNRRLRFSDPEYLFKRGFSISVIFIGVYFIGVIGRINETLRREFDAIHDDEKKEI